MINDRTIKQSSPYSDTPLKGAILPMITTNRAHDLRSSQGFTLVELLVVVAIIGVLAAVAIPQFKEYRKRAFDSHALFDLKSVIIAEEAYFSDSDVYLSALPLPTFTGASPGVNLTLIGDEDSFQVSASHDKGAMLFSFDSDVGTIDAEPIP